MASHRIDNAARDPEEHRLTSIRAGKKGGPAAAAAKKRNRTMRELTQLILSTELLDSDELKQQLVDRGIEPTGAGAILFAQLAKAAKGDTAAATYLRDTSGQKPVDGLLPGEIDESKPLESYDLTKLSDAQLRRLAASRRGTDPDTGESE